jgi:hypothetical protein
VGTAALYNRGSQGYHFGWVPKACGAPNITPATLWHTEADAGPRSHIHGASPQPGGRHQAPRKEVRDYCEAVGT